MILKKILFFIMIVLATCSGKDNKGAENVTTTVMTAEIAYDEIIIPNYDTVLTNSILRTMYVSAKNGLRIRDRPGLQGNIIGVLEYKNQVTIYERGNEQFEIDGLSNYWYLIQRNDVNGWVFGGYLYDTLEDIEKEEFIGMYYASHIEILVSEQVTHKDWFRLMNNNLNGTDAINFEITCDENGLYFIEHNFPMFTPRRENLHRRWLREPIWRNEPFYSLSGEMGGGGSYLYLYYKHENMSLKIEHLMNWGGCLDEDPNPVIERFEGIITFEKR